MGVYACALCANLTVSTNCPLLNLCKLLQWLLFCFCFFGIEFPSRVFKGGVMFNVALEHLIVMLVVMCGEEMFKCKHTFALFTLIAVHLSNCQNSLFAFSIFSVVKSIVNL